MWTREMLKTNAKTLLKKHYWMVFLACLVAGILGGSLDNGGVNYNAFTARSGIGSLGQSQTDTTPSTDNNLYSIPEARPYFPDSEIRDTRKIDAIAFVIFVFLFVFILVIAIVSVFMIFVANPIRVGLCRYLMEARQDKIDMGTLFWAFGSGRYMNIVKIMFFRYLYIALWSLLFIIPGIVKSYEYFYIPWLLAENPQMSKDRAFDLSNKMTYGDKGRIWILDLSFIGWNCLAVLTCGIGVLFLAPYIAATLAELYAFAREREIYHHPEIARELPGFKGSDGQLTINN
ncbi:MAG: DUF975 family protein [Oscillospiraceae bacterium]|nr:DUF975 family protein [Oscillospiraceae bacterium]